MLTISINRVPMTAEQSFQTLKEHGVLTNRYAEEYISHPCFAWTDQPQSQNSVLSGTHSSPDGAITVLSELLEGDDAFPKGLYLRKVDGNLWLRGYVCDSAYRFPGDALFALEMRRT